MDVRKLWGMSRRRGQRICVLVSGGADSAVLLARMLRRVERILPVYVRCGLRWEAVELYWLRRLLRAMRSPRLAPLRVIDMPMRSLYGAHWSLRGRHVPSRASADGAVYLPGRNVLLITAAAIVCAEQRISTIALGLLQGNPFGDATPQFLRQLASTLAMALRRPIRIVAPLAQVRKAALTSTSSVPMALTFSCLRPWGRFHCGRCNKCAERQRAFHLAGVADPTSYAR